MNDYKNITIKTSGNEVTIPENLLNGIDISNNKYSEFEIVENQLQHRYVNKNNRTDIVKLYNDNLIRNKEKGIIKYKIYIHKSKQSNARLLLLVYTDGIISGPIIQQIKNI